MKQKSQKQSEATLLDGYKPETQAKDKPYKIAFRVIIIAVLFLLMTISFYHVFSGKTYLETSSYLYKGTLSAKKYYETNDCALLKIEKKKQNTTYESGDELYFMSATSEGSGVLVSSMGNLAELKLEDGSILTINNKFILGKVTKKISVIGIIFGLVQSYYGAISFMLLLIGFTVYISLSRINYENTDYGIRLAKIYKQQKLENKERKKVLKLMKKAGDTSEKIAEMLSNNYEINKSNFDLFEKEKFTSSHMKYKYISYVVHEDLVTKQNLQKKESRWVVSLLELLGEVNEVDQDIEYMLVDLLVKGKLAELNKSKVKETVLGLLDKDLKQADLMNIASILYVLDIKNPQLLQSFKVEIIDKYMLRAREICPDAENVLKKASLTQKKL